MLAVYVVDSNDKPLTTADQSRDCEGLNLRSWRIPPAQLGGVLSARYRESSGNCEAPNARLARSSQKDAYPLSAMWPLAAGSNGSFGSS